jgi:hypothetical protein
VRTTRNAAIDKIKRADHERDEVARQRLRLGRHHSLHATGFFALDEYGRVGERYVFATNVERELPRDLEARLIEAGERSSRIEGLEERVRVPVVALVVGVDAAAALAVDTGAVVDLQRCGAHVHRSRQHDADKVLVAGHDARRLSVDGGAQLR